MDFEQTRTLLLATNDQQVGKLVGLLEKVFRPARFRPDAGILARERAVIDEAKAVFPAPFAIKFSFWADRLTAELNVAAEALRNADADADDMRREELEMMLRLRFRAAALQLEACWKQIVHFLPFILIASLRRLHDDVIRREGAQLLGRVLRSYNAFYVKHEIERQLEADQYHLLVALLKLFRLLSERWAPIFYLRRSWRRAANPSAASFQNASTPACCCCTRSATA